MGALTVDSLMGNIDPLHVLFARAAEKKRPRRGKFIIFEGIDGSGKTTQARLAASALRLANHAVDEVKQPSGGPFGEPLRRILFEDPGTARIHPEAVELLFLANFVHNRPLVAEALAAGVSIVSDRWYYSHFAYGNARGTVFPPIDEMWRNHEGPTHDVLFICYGDPVKLLDRANRRPDKKQAGKTWNDAGTQARVQAEFVRMCGQDPRTVFVPSDIRGAKDIFRSYVGPQLEERFHIVIDYDQVLADA